MNTPKVARILAVDDSPANIVTVRGMLGPDYEVSFATSGPQALEMLAQGYRPDLILLDVMMPEMDGYAVCAALKADPATQAIPVLFITARADPQSETRALSAGGLDFIHKPLHAAVLRARVGLHLALRRQAQALSQAYADLSRQAEALSTANAELSQHRDHLEDLVYARTAELAAARDAAESTNRAKSAFLLTVGHELHTPLHQIMGILPLVSTRLEDARLRDWWTKAADAAQHLLRLINDILHYVESESQDIAIASADFELAALLATTERRIRPAAEAKGLELVVAVEPAAAIWLKGDAVRLERVLWNLLDNAVKFSERGSAAHADLGRLGTDAGHPGTTISSQTRGEDKMVIEQLSKQAATRVLQAGAVTGHFDLEGVGLVVLQDGRILEHQASHRCTVRGSAREPLTPYQFARSMGQRYRLRARGLMAGGASAYA